MREDGKDELEGGHDERLLWLIALAFLLGAAATGWLGWTLMPAPPDPPSSDASPAP